MKRYNLAPPKLRTLLIVLVLTYTLVFAALGLLAGSLHNASVTDCRRTDAIVKGIYSIVDRGLARQQAAYTHGVITPKQYQLAVSEAGRIHRDITRPHC